MKYAINYVLGRENHTLVVDAPDRDDAYSEARSLLVRCGLFSASLQGSCRPASQDDIEKSLGLREPLTDNTGCDV